MRTAHLLATHASVATGSQYGGSPQANKFKQVSSPV